MENNILEIVKKTIEEYSMIKKGETILVAFSHGPDSTALLHILNIFKKEYNIRIKACYVDHGLRNETEEEIKKSKEFCKKYEIDFLTKKVDTRKYANKYHLSIEMAARELRYKTLFQVKDFLNTDKIATGHTLTDSIETIILKTTRGTSPESLTGIPAVRGCIIRPLIEVTREEVLNFIKRDRLSFVIDRSNKDLKIKRNFVRHKILPLLNELNPKYEYNFLNLMKQIRDDLNFINKNMIEMDKIFKKTEKGILLDISLYFGYTSSIRSRALKNLFPYFEYRDIKTIESLRNRRNGYKINVKKGFFAIKEENKIFIGEIGRKKREEVFELNKEVKFGEYWIEKNIVEYEYFGKHYKEENKEFFDHENIEFPLRIRRRKDGDFLIIKEGKKKLKDIFIDKKIPWRKRELIPVIEDKKGILWIPGIKRSYRGFVTEKSEKIIELKYRSINE